VRGFPSHSLSPAEGDTRLWHASAEYRLPLYGDPRRPRLAGLLFVDAGRAGDDGRETSAAAGWGLRIRLGWLGWLGTDIAFPLTDSPADEGFHGHASLGWSF
jgi:outer membrane translocation and assembly module TamA